MFNLTNFISYVLLTAFTPGPNNIMTMSIAGKYGFKKGFRFCFGVFLGCLVVMTLCAIFSAALFEFIPKVAPFMKYAGAIYILWLAYKTYTDKPAKDEDEIGSSEKKETLKKNLVFNGMIIQIINPKTILYGITSISTFILPYFKTIPYLALFVFILSFVGLISTGTWAVFGSVFKKVFEKYYKILNIVLALLLVYCAITLIL